MNMMNKLLFMVIMTMSGIAFGQCADIYQHQFKTLQGDTLNLCEYQNKPILVVNTASKCGFTPQFEALESLYKQQQSNMLIVGFPSNDFNQELKSDKEIGDFCKKTYQVNFPMVSRTSVVGPNANPLYKKLTQATHQAPMWNFYKYLILPEGKKIYAFSSDIAPDSPELMDKLKPYLKK